MSRVNPIPHADGQQLVYAAAGHDRTRSPQVFYVNGIRTPPEVHRDVAVKLSAITERTVIGIYNLHDKLSVQAPFGSFSEDGYIADLVFECIPQWLQAATADLGEKLVSRLDAGLRALPGNLDTIRKNGKGLPIAVDLQLRAAAHGARSLQALVDALCTNFPQSVRRTLADTWVAAWPAAKTLYRLLTSGDHHDAIVVAHSQGNLITVHAFWAMKLAHGAGFYRNMKVFSLASPVPAWPDGTWAKLYALTGDPVAMLSLGRTFRGPGADVKSDVGFAAHDVDRNMQTTEFLRELRRHLGLKPLGGS